MKKNERYAYFTMQQELPLDELAAMVSDALEHEDVAVFVAKIDALAEDWGVTAALIQHFKYLEEIYKSEVAGSDKDANLPPKKLI